MRQQILITGSTDGIGKIAANQLAQLGHKVFIHGRNPDKLKSTLSEIKSAIPDAQIESILGDLSDFASIRTMSDDLLNKTDSLDILIHNAGIYNSPMDRTKDGLDIRFMVNYLAPIVLSQNWMPLFEKSTKKRIVSLSSAAQSSISLAALRGEQTMQASEAYAQSKLAITSWSFDLGIEHPELSAVALNPGSLLNTKMVAEAFGKHWSPAEKGSDKICQLALADSIENTPYSYYDNDAGKYARAHADAYDEDKRSQLKATTIDILAKFD